MTNDNTSGYTTNLDNEMATASESMGSTFSNIQECYV